MEDATVPDHEWITDIGGESFAHVYRVDRLLHDARSPYQRVRVIENADFGRMLILDEAVQTTERDDFIYHELLGHVPLCTHPAPKRALVIGGGDGGLLREVLRQPLEHATMVELDRAVVDATLRFIPSVPGNVYDDPRARLLIQDGIVFVRETAERFDVAMVDSTDPSGPSLGLFSTEFYGNMARVLGRAGVLAVQSGSPLYQQDLVRMVRQNMTPHFRFVRTYLGTVPTYPGVLWTFTIGSQARDPVSLTEDEIAARLRGVATRYYTPAGHARLFDLPPFLRADLGLD
ncbi:MAG: polyamine aminopropyltransferase [Armatimonadota bacterium]|nr:polyamine aminopropyltransferase [Armatimonadota bacterium]